MKDFEPLSDALSDLVDAERSAPPLPSVQRDALFARVAQSLPPSPAALSTPPDALPPDAPLARGASAVLKRKWFPLSCLLLGVGAGALGQRALDAPDRTPAQVARVEIRLPAVVQEQPTTATVTTSTAAAGPPTAEASAHATTPPSRAPSAIQRAPAAGDLERERLILGAARTAIRRGDFVAALGALGEHARAFPDGQLAAERELLLEQMRKVPAPAVSATPNATSIP